MLGHYRLAAKLVASRVALSSTELVTHIELMKASCKNIGMCLNVYIGHINTAYVSLIFEDAPSCHLKLLC
jgi:hypothetical protein